MNKNVYKILWTNSNFQYKTKRKVIVFFLLQVLSLGRFSYNVRYNISNEETILMSVVKDLYKKCPF